MPHLPSPFDQGRGEVRGIEGVHSDVAGSGLQREHLGELDDRSLARRVRGLPFRRHEPEKQGHVDDLVSPGRYLELSVRLGAIEQFLRFNSSTSENFSGFSPSTSLPTDEKCSRL